jgi:prepilin-type N-terminal cleavage/methylation domain-containing protein
MPSPSSFYTLVPDRTRSPHQASGCRSLIFGRGGFTLLELITVVTLLGLALGELLPAGRSLLDRMAVVSAREAAVGLFHRVRMEAVTRGGARLVVESSPPMLRVLSGSSSQIVKEVPVPDGVTLELSRGRLKVELRFDAMGLGRVASQTLVFQRGEARATLVVSSLGRVTRK